MQIFQFYSLSKNENEYYDNCKEKGEERHDLLTLVSAKNLRVRSKEKFQKTKKPQNSSRKRQIPTGRPLGPGVTSCQDFARDGCRCTKKAQGVVTMRVQEKRTFGQGGRRRAKKCFFGVQKQCFFGKKCTITWYILHIMLN